MQVIHILETDSWQLLIHLYNPLKGIFILEGLQKLFLLPIISLVILVISVYIFLKLYNFNSLLHRHRIILELTPPANTEISSYTTQQLFSILRSIGTQRTIKQKCLGQKKYYSLELISHSDEGIRYIITTTPEDKIIIEHSIRAYLPSILIKQREDYLEKTNQKFAKIVAFKLKNHYALPLAKQNALSLHDPVAYITAMMTKLKDGELVALQIVLTPAKSKEVSRLSHMLLTQEDILSYLRITKRKPGRVVSLFEQEIINSVQEKIDQPLFQTTIRLLVAQQTKSEKDRRIRAMISSFAPFSYYNYQSLITRARFSLFIPYKVYLFTFTKRLPSTFPASSNLLLSLSEMADIYHFPFTKTTQTEDMIKNISPEFPAPLLLKNEKNLDVVFGKNSYGNSETIVGLTDDERTRHVYLIGQTGSGKSTVLFHMAREDIQKGKGVCVLDPHGDLVEDLLTTIPVERINDVVYINPFDIKHPIGINLLELTPGLDEDEGELEKELVAESVISIFRRIFANEEKIDAHRIEYIIRNTIYTAFYVKKATLFTIYDLLTDREFRNKIVATLDNRHLQNFWKNEFSRAGDYQVVKMTSGVTAKVGRFLFSPIARRMLEQPASTINFDELLEKGKIIICNLSEGKIGEDTSYVLGTAIITKIHLAVLKRARQEREFRKPFYLYIDEFQNFATNSFTKLLSGGRKFGLHVTMAEQSTSQQYDRRIINVILANVGTVICFKTSSPVDEQLMLSQFHPLIEKGNISNLPRYHFYIKLGAKDPQQPFSAKTLPVEIQRDTNLVTAIVQASQKNYACLYVKPIEITKKTIKKKSKNEDIKEKDLEHYLT